MSMPIDLRDRTILIVDDTPANLTLAVAMLEQQGLRLSVAQSGDEALRRVAFAPPDLILLDVMLPGIDGFEVCRRLKASAATAAIPVIFMTALRDTADKVAGFAAGAVDYVTKPLQSEEVVARVTTHLRLAAMQAQLQAQNALLARENQERRIAERILQQYRDSLEQQVAERTAEVRELAAHRESAREDERKHIARELHDELGQSLTALRMRAALLRVRFGADVPGLNEQVRDMTELVDRSLSVVRNVATSLRPTVLDLGIGSALEWLVDEFRTHSGLNCSLTLMLEEQGSPGEQQAIALFRIVQESLTNIARHADASETTVTLRCAGGRCELQIVDDGRGFDLAQARPHSFGLLGIRERVLSLDGKVTISSVPGSRTCIEVILPRASA
ncbi:signal transduction histidine kinase [Duganella sp. SG902]|uniref:ATP-binding response regulator n=1 Tax=Duganella sp. SG902 TaxID=2587016 RepID=UPI00159D7CD9|nr:response regulator [Duganella sp. SG902]NVM79144.1 signal transduction histidine kinase [Duganella sp. SG902]